MYTNYRHTLISLSEDLPAVACLHFDTLDSTMQAFEAVPWPCAPDVPRVAMADYQAAGRGQQGTAWESAHGENLLFTLAVKPKRVAAEAQFALSIISALAARACCVASVSEAARLTMKWPNDLYYHDSKLAGTLIQHTLSGAYLDTTLVGVGLNVNQLHFVSDAPNPISLYNITGQTHDRTALLRAYLTAFFTHLTRLEANPNYADTLWTHYHAHLYRRQGWHTYKADGRVFSAKIKHIDRLGRLHLCHADGTQRAYAFKEVAALLT